MFKTLDDLIADRHGLAGKPVLVREDLNVPIHEGRVSDDTRLRAAMPTLAELADHGAKVLVLAHFGRPKGKVDPAFTLRPIAHALSEVMGRPVGFLESPDRHAIDVLDPGSITVLENSAVQLQRHGARRRRTLRTWTRGCTLAQQYRCDFACSRSARVSYKSTTSSRRRNASTSSTSPPATCSLPESQ